MAFTATSDENRELAKVFSFYIFKMAVDSSVMQDCCLHDWSWNPRDKSPDIVLSGERGEHVKFKWSVGTAAVRGTKALPKDCRSFWEMSLKHPFYGTSIMFGVGTKNSRLRSESFVNLLGEDGESVGLSHKGLLWSEGTPREYTRPFFDRKTTVIGLLFDGYTGALTYYKDGEPMGVAFRELYRLGCDIYPMVSSTAAQIEITLLNTKRSYYGLQDRCGALLAATLTSAEHAERLPIPPALQRYVETYIR